MPAAHVLQRPQVLASLPRPVDSTSGRYVVGDVYNGLTGSRKRRRAELAVGIDGEGINFYDTAKLITSYALSPQSKFTCPPYSFKIKSTDKTGLMRKTYLSTREATARITLLQDDGSAGSETTTTTHELPKSGHSTCLLTPMAGVDDGKSHVLVVREDGEMRVLDPDDLTLRWSCAASAFRSSTDSDATEILFAHLTTAEEAKKGFPVHLRDTSAPSHANILVLITGAADSRSRRLHIIELPLLSTAQATSQSIQSLASVNLPQHDQDVYPPSTYRIHVASGVLYELVDGTVFTFDVTGTIPQLMTTFSADSATSLLRLSSTALLTSSAKSVSVWNPKFKALHASLDAWDLLDQDDSRRRIPGPETENRRYQLIAYFPKLETVTAICGNKLVALQVESQQAHAGKRRAAGLLIDSLGCGMQTSAEGKKLKSSHLKLSSFAAYIAGSGRSFWSGSETRIKELDRFVVAQDIVSFEKRMAKLLEMKLEGKAQGDGDEPRENGVSNEADADHAVAVASWKWPKRPQDVPTPDPGWAAYCLSRMFTWTRATSHGDDGSPPAVKLTVAFYPHNVVNWLMRTGYLTVANVEAALKHSPEGRLGPAVIPPGQLMEAIIEVDPELELLMAFLSNTLPSAPELLFAIRHLMRSLELLTDRDTARLLTNGRAPPAAGDEDLTVAAEADDVESALRLAEYHLGDGSNIRGHALGLALSKLYCHPASAVVPALQSVFSGAEIMSLIYLLRFELAKGSWTSRYVDRSHLRSLDAGGEESDTSITLIASLLNHCVDAVGAGGWLSGAALLASGDAFEHEELVSSLQLEVSAALEGIEEAEYLRGLTGEVIRYGAALHRHTLPKDRKKGKVVPVTLTEQSSMLPIGLKVEQQVTQHRVGAGGEVRRRTARDVGRLKSQKVGKYTRERIVI